VGKDALPSLRKFGYYTAPGVPTATEVAQALRAMLRDELPAAIEPIVASVVRIHLDRGDVRVGLALVGELAGAVVRRQTARIRFWAAKEVAVQMGGFRPAWR
jgi:hypothetical protein